MRLTTLLIAAVVSAPLVGEEPRADSRLVVVPNCQVLLIHEVEVPAEEAGRLLGVNVTEGDSVTKDSLLAQIDDGQALLDKVAAELERDAAKARAEDDIDVRFSQKSFELAAAELGQDEEINRRSPGTVPEAELRRKRLACTRAELQIDRSRLDMKVARMSAEIQDAAVQAAHDNILRRRILAPFDGLVVHTHRQAGEWVNAGEPVARVIRMDRLRVDGFVSGAEHNVSEIAGRAVTVEVELARGRREQFRGQVVFVNPLIQAGNRYRVRAEVENRQERGQWLLNPGSTVTMGIHLE